MSVRFRLVETGAQGDFVWGLLFVLRGRRWKQAGHVVLERSEFIALGKWLEGEGWASDDAGSMRDG